jgi:multiple sugar transport system substrate-binding protein
MKRTILAALLILGSFTLAFAGGGGEKPAQTSTPAVAPRVTFVLDKGMSQFGQDMLNIFNTQQKEVFATLVVLPYDANAVHDDFVTKLAARDTTYTLLGLDVIYLPEFAKAGWVIDLSSHFKKDYTDQFLPGGVAGGRYDGKQCGLPWSVNASALFGRKDVLEAAGAKMPTTWAEYTASMDKLTGKEGTQYGTLLQGKLSEAMVCNWLEFIWANGGDVLDEKGNVVVNSPQNVEATEFFATLCTKYAPKGTSTYAEPDTRPIYMAGTTVFYRDWAGTIRTMESDPSSKVAGKVVSAPLPLGPKGTKAPGALGGLQLVINAACDKGQQAAGLKLMEFLLSKETQNTMGIVRTFPGRISSYTDPQVTKAKADMPALFALFNNAKPRPQTPLYAKLSDSIQRNIHLVITGESKAAVSLEKLQNELKAILGQAK